MTTHPLPTQAAATHTQNDPLFETIETIARALGRGVRRPEERQWALLVDHPPLAITYIRQNYAPVRGTDNPQPRDSIIYSVTLDGEEVHGFGSHRNNHAQYRFKEWEPALNTLYAQATQQLSCPIGIRRDTIYEPDFVEPAGQQESTTH
jgi:hypothetical protein